MKEIKALQEQFKYVIRDSESDFITNLNILEKEKKDALVVSQYKEFFKMEMFKRDEEQTDIEKEREIRRLDIRRQEKLEKKR